MATFYEVQEKTGPSTWANTWASEDNWAYYNTEAEALSDIEYFLANYGGARENFRIAPVAASIAFKGL